MAILIILVVVFFGSWWLSDDFDNGWSLLNVISGILLLLFIVSIPISRISLRSEMVEFASVYETLHEARKNKDISPLELAAIQQKVVDSNKWLASSKYWNSTFFDIYYPDEIDQLQPIK